MNKLQPFYNLLPQIGLGKRKTSTDSSVLFMRTLQLLALAIWCLGGLVSCKQEDISATTSTFVANVTDINNYAISKGISGSSTASGLYFAVTKASSSSVTAVYQDELEFTYKMYVLSGPSNSTVTSATATSSTVVTDKLVDTVYARTPTFVPFFAGVLKAGLEEGLLKMNEGASVILLVPSTLAFGDVATTTSGGVVPANSPVRFDVTLNRARTETQRLNEYAASTGLSFTTTSTGLRFALTKANPSGDSAVAVAQNKKGLTLDIRYVGKQLYARNAIGFDSTGTGLNQYNNAGFKEALSRLRVGERATVLFPSLLGYGTSGLVVGESDKTYKIPPYTPLRYDIEVVSAR